MKEGAMTKKEGDNCRFPNDSREFGNGMACNQELLQHGSECSTGEEVIPE